MLKIFGKLRQTSTAILNTNLFEKPTVLASQIRCKKSNSKDISSLFMPVAIKPNSDNINVGAELSGSLNKADLLKVLNKFLQKPEIKQLLTDSGFDTVLGNCNCIVDILDLLQHQVSISFRKFCSETKNLPVDLHIVLSDVLQGAANVTDIFPYFLRHAKQMFPHLDFLDDLKKISDLRTPANWYPEARLLNRKIIFHAGPTNSGKTYHALEKFISSESGVYCGPLKLLASEVFSKCNNRGTTCDLVTGEERRYADPSGKPSSHVACTVEMAAINIPFDVAVIDEIQMIKDRQRGWAWSRALLGLMAKEIHLCGEAGTLDLIKKLCETTGETVEMINYKRLTELTVEDRALESLDNVQPGDCIVCFSKNDIYTVSRQIESRGKEVAVIYGSLPPGTKLAQAAKFNDPQNSCKILVATDAIGMGLNLSIRRIIFYSLIKPIMNEKGEKEMDTISVSSALQIAGRAGRFGTQWEKGYVTTFNPEDLPTLKVLLASQPEAITQAGLHPTADQIELYAYHLRDYPLSNLMDIFVNLSTVDDTLYFMCNIEDFKFLADMIQHIPLSLNVKYLFCCSPINKKMPFVCSMFVKFARQYSNNQPITCNFIIENIGWPVKPPNTIIDLVHLEAVFDVLDLYLWLSYRFTDLFVDAPLVRQMQKELDEIIQDGVVHITRLLRNTENNADSGRGIESLLNNAKRWNVKNSSREILTGKGRLSQKLIDEGILTPLMLNELRKEWNKQQKDDTTVDNTKTTNQHQQHSFGSGRNRKSK